MKRNAIIGLAAGAMASVGGALIATFAAGGGHGTYLPAKILFPFAMLLSVFGSSITAPYMVAALLQFPIYGLVLGAAVGSRSFKALAVALACSHVAVAALDISAPADSVFSMEPVDHLTARWSEPLAALRQG
jgi:hypothetical protein